MPSILRWACPGDLFRRFSAGDPFRDCARPARSPERSTGPQGSGFHENVDVVPNVCGRAQSPILATPILLRGEWVWPSSGADLVWTPHLGIPKGSVGELGRDRLGPPQPPRQSQDGDADPRPQSRRGPAGRSRLALGDALACCHGREWRPAGGCGAAASALGGILELGRPPYGRPLAQIGSGGLACARCGRPLPIERKERSSPARTPVLVCVWVCNKCVCVCQKPRSSQVLPSVNSSHPRQLLAANMQRPQRHESLMWPLTACHMWEYPRCVWHCVASEAAQPKDVRC